MRFVRRARECVECGEEVLVPTVEGRLYDDGGVRCTDCMSEEGES